MQIQTSLRHRHFVAVPIAVLLLAFLAMVDRAMPVHALRGELDSPKVMRAQGRDETTSVIPGMSVLLRDGTIVHGVDGGSDLTLDHGTLYLRCDVLCRILLPSSTATVFGSSIAALRDEASVTLVAVKGPMFVGFDGRSIVVPEGHQWRLSSEGSALSLVPESWLQEASALIAGLPSLPPERPSSDLLRFVATGAGPVDVLGPSDRLGLVAAVFDGSVDLSLNGFDRVLHVLEPFLTGVDDRAIFAIRLLLSHTISIDPPTAMMLLSQIADDSLLADEIVATVPMAAARLKRPLQPALIEYWGRMVRRMLVSNTPRAGVALLAALRLPDAYIEAGYPVQASLWRRALSGLEADAMPPAADTVPVPDASVPGSPSLSPSSLSEAQILSATRVLLDRHGALFTEQTRIALDGDHPKCASVRNIFLVLEGRDTSFDFSYCPHSDSIRSIVRDGVRLPNTVPADRFFTR